MRITTLTLKNFRSHEMTRLELDRLTIIRGANGAGKSSIQMALDLLLTGRCMVTDSAGRGAEQLIRHGAQELQVEAELDNPVGRIKLARNKSGGTLMFEPADGKQPRLNNLAKAQLATAVAEPEVLGAVLNSGRFVEMNAKEQKEFLAAAVGTTEVAIDPEILKLMPADFPAKLRSAVEVDSYHKTLFDQRTQVGRDLKALGDIPEPAVPEDMPSTETVKAQIDGLQGDYQATTKRIAQAQSDHAQARMAINAAKDQKAVLIQAARTQKQLAEQNMLEAPMLASLLNTFEHRIEIDSWAKGVNQLEAERGAMADTIRRLERIDGPCPTCTRALPKVTREKLVKQLGEDMAHAGVAISNLKEKLAPHPYDPEYCIAEIKRNKTAEEQAQAAVAKLQELEGDGDQAEPVYPAEPDVTEDLAAASEIMARIKRGQEVLQRIAEIEGSRKAYALQRQHKAALDERLATLEKLVQYFGADLKAKLLGGKMAGLIADLNLGLARFGFVANFQLEPYRLEIRYLQVPEERFTKDAPLQWLTLAQLSESERYRFGIAFQVALAVATGVKFIVVDRADMLTPDIRTHLGAMLLDSQLDQAIVLVTSDLGEVGIPPGGVTVVNIVNNGGTTAISHTNAALKELTYDAIS